MTTLKKILRNHHSGEALVKQVQHKNSKL
jgi:hypothetical protein